MTCIKAAAQGGGQGLDAAIRADIAAGHKPIGVVLCVGGTLIGATDPIRTCLQVAMAHDLYTHVDASWAENAVICPEFRPFRDGVDGADSIVFNPYKWIGAQFGDTVQFLADPTPQARTRTIGRRWTKSPISTNGLCHRATGFVR